MKKLLIASAALAMVAGTAQAQSSVTVYGVLDIGVSEVKNKTTVQATGATTSNKISNTGNGDGALATSRLGFRGTEDLGGGRKANFQLEYDLTDIGTGSTAGTGAAATAATSAAGTSYANLGARYSWVGLEDAKLGQLRLGQQETTMHSVFTAGLAGGANNMTGSVYSAGDSVHPISTNSAGIRPYDVFVSRAITYISPVISGVRFEVQSANYSSTSSTVGTLADTRTALNAASLKYSLGGLNLAAAMQQTKVDALADSNALLKRDSQAFTANYNFGPVTGFAVYTTDKVQNLGSLLRDTKTTEIGVQLPVGKTVFWASAYDGSRDGITGGTTLTTADANANADVSGYQLGARHDLSKRTALYAIVGQQEVKASQLTSTNKSVESTGMAVGVRHSF
jgi:predicted porin